LAVRSRIVERRRAAKRGCRSGSALERGVRPHSLCADLTLSGSDDSDTVT